MTKKPSAKDWRNRKLEDWNTTTFRAYLADRHEELFNVRYVAKSIKRECGMIKNLLDAYGPHLVKEFIDRGFKRYKPNPRYPGICFETMYTWYKRDIQTIEYEMNKRREQQAAVKVEHIDADSLKDWF